MPTEIFSRLPGQPATRPEGEGLVTLHGDQTPDTVVLPADLGGREVRVLRADEAPCPMRGCGAHRRLVVDAEAPGGGQVGVIECVPRRYFFWVRIEP